VVIKESINGVLLLLDGWKLRVALLGRTSRSWRVLPWRHFAFAIYMGATIRQGAMVSAMAIVVILLMGVNGVSLTFRVCCENNHRARLHRITEQSFHFEDQLMYGCQECNWNACCSCATN
jgi:hypothetical protein